MELSLQLYFKVVGVTNVKFALLFWDILFSPLPGVFETPFQTAPLDLATDAFFPLRRSAINARLAEIGNGCGPFILKQNFEREKSRETWCVGLNWNYAMEDLLEILEVTSAVSMD
jgi:Fanconi-associated nuclease 1